MSSFTMKLKTAIEHVELVGENIGLSDYPIFDEAHREVLNKKIVDHYWNHEIGMETIEMFRLALKRKMNEIMVFYNQLYTSENLIINPITNVNITTANTGTSTQNTSTTANSESTSDVESGGRAVSSETPQTMLSGNGDYATSANDSTAKTVTTGAGEESADSETTAASDSNTTMSGYQGSPHDLLMAYRETMMNIDMMIINELSDLFMLIWDNSDAYYNQYNY